jgi:hypothetical protein
MMEGWWGRRDLFECARLGYKQSGHYMSGSAAVESNQFHGSEAEIR